MQIPIHIFTASVANGTFVHLSTPSYLGYAEVNEFDPEGIFNLCNWEHWAESRPQNLYADISSCNHGLMLYYPKKDEYWLALSSSWISGSKEELCAYVEQHKHDIWWGEKEERENV